MMMTTLTRKQREIAEREQLIKDVARRMLVSEGYLALNMDRIAAEIEYSKGTIYQHFSSKEDLVGALVAETMERRSILFRRVLDFDGRPRERIVGIGVADELFFRLYPDHFKTEQVMHVNSIAAKIAEERRAQVHLNEASCLEIVLSIVRDAVDQGHLVLAEGGPECLVLFGLRTMAIGAHSLVSQGLADMPPLADADINAALWMNYARLLDGYGWKPLSSEWDYDATRRRIEEEVFSEEMQELQR